MTSHDESPRTSKSSSPPEELDSRILKGYCGVKELSNPNLLHIELKAYAEEEETPENEQRESNCQETSPRTGLSPANRDHKKEERSANKDSLPGHPKKKRLTQWVSHENMVKEQFQKKLSPALNAHN